MYAPAGMNAPARINVLASMNVLDGMNAREQDNMAMLCMCVRELHHTARARETQRTLLC